MVGVHMVSDDYDYMFKIVLVGDSGVGKSCLMSRFVRNEFNLDSKPTIGVEFLAKTVQILSKEKGSFPKYVKAQVWDTAGQERYQALTKAFYRGAFICIVCYDITKRKSFEHVPKWLNELRSNCEPHRTVLVGTKSDLKYLREVSTEEAATFANQEELMFMETSSQDSMNVEEAFEEAIAEVYKIVCQTQPECGEDDGPMIICGGGIRPPLEPEPKKTGCCGK